ncbi:hypothetical protein BLNAU_3654 [Blattamonas nauphoetae]|uniref:PilZ domain-containing protein n=1 Tax=Blattamonas nauphoetae TaxID=2049346 RepID=A0ABQ9WWY1_9EUKA|nr:hypothetical protein BLNAU_24363 [Blattamonas nauphoetae]KAK2944011.1 hypothetical protein BLNAU_21059 [Blattamonas nauphoetae]KAK2944149.1 hypothetical protein BLNAU_20934 [Blattamonas nauphoetae]KAK2951310.1 hypothetical protein BLNAU_13797 [Blattamonas nauphoetae]KAK2956370.1 hypothetical protein BLNAU_8737 [Blattamonas nauphoetae]
MEKIRPFPLQVKIISRLPTRLFTDCTGQVSVLNLSSFGISSLDDQNPVLTGCYLKITEVIVGTVVFTEETKGQNNILGSTSITNHLLQRAVRSNDFSSPITLYPNKCVLILAHSNSTLHECWSRETVHPLHV